MIGREYLDNFYWIFLVEWLSTLEIRLFTLTVNSYFLIMKQ